MKSAIVTKQESNLLKDRAIQRGTDDARYNRIKTLQYEHNKYYRIGVDNHKAEVRKMKLDLVFNMPAELMG